MGLLAWMFQDTPYVFDRFGPPLLAIFPFIMMFVVTSVTMLRERSSGTLERLLTMPVSRLDILLGYALSFGIAAIVQAALACAASLYVFNMQVAGPEWFLLVVALADALLGMALGLLASAFARTEFQAVQFMPAFVLPQLLLCGLVVPLPRLPDILHWVANILPLTYAIQAMQGVAQELALSAQTVRDVAIVLGFMVCAVALAAVTLRRQTR
jgi:ABC-2 type transport system permease protein